MDPRRARARLLRNGGYQHAVQPIAAFAPEPMPAIAPGGKPQVTFASADDPHYKAMLEIIRAGRQAALAAPRVDMPGAEIIPGKDRMFIPPPVPQRAPTPRTTILPPSATDGAAGLAAVRLTWERSARTIGLEAEVHRGETPDFVPGDKTLLARTPLCQYLDAALPPSGNCYYALILTDGKTRSEPAYAAVLNIRFAAAPPATTAK